MGIHNPHIRSENCCDVRFNVMCSGRNGSAIYRVLLPPSPGQTDSGDSRVPRKAIILLPDNMGVTVQKTVFFVATVAS